MKFFFTYLQNNNYYPLQITPLVLRYTLFVSRNALQKSGDMPFNIRNLRRVLIVVFTFEKIKVTRCHIWRIRWMVHLYDLFFFFDKWLVYRVLEQGVNELIIVNQSSRCFLQHFVSLTTSTIQLFKKYS